MSLVEEYMSTRVATRHSKASVLDVSKAMADLKISSVAITDEQNKRIIGVLTERDVIRGIANGMHPEQSIVDSLMSTPIVSIRNDQPIEEAVRLMIRNKVRLLLVEDASHGAVGMITTTDLARYLRQKTQKEGSGQEQEQDQRSSDLASEVWELYF